jgi:hypothetical protein
MPRSVALPRSGGLLQLSLRLQGRAKRAGPVADRPHLQERRTSHSAGVDRRRRAPQLLGRNWPLPCVGRRLPSFGPAGPRRRRRGGLARGPPCGLEPSRAAVVSGAAKRAIPPAPHPEALRIAVKSAPAARRCASPSGLWTAPRRDSRGANRRDGRLRTLAE